jgi:hypothetical protein
MRWSLLSNQAKFRERLLEINIDTQKADRSMILAVF